MKKSKLILPITLLIFYATYCLVVFLVSKTFPQGFWISFGFVTLAYLFMDFSLMYVSHDNIKKQVVGLPVGTMSVMYFIVEMILGTVFMFVNVSFLAYFLPQIILFALFLLCFIPAILSDKNYKEEQPKEDKAQEENK